MSKSKDDEIAELEEQIRQTNNKLKKKKAEKREQDRKERDARLVQWGIVVEKLLTDPNKKFSEQTLANQCFEYLSGRSLDRALTGPLQPFAEQRDQGKRNQSEQSQQSTQKQQPRDQQQGDSSDQNPPPQS